MARSKAVRMQIIVLFLHIQTVCTTLYSKIFICVYEVVFLKVFNVNSVNTFLNIHP